MNDRIADRPQGFIEQVVGAGRYGSANAGMGEGRRCAAERDARLQGLRDTLDASSAAGVYASEAEIDAALEAVGRDLAARGFGPKGRRSS